MLAEPALPGRQADSPTELAEPALSTSGPKRPPIVAVVFETCRLLSKTPLFALVGLSMSRFADTATNPNWLG